MISQCEQTVKSDHFNQPSCRLLSRTDPIANESPLGYLRRVAGQLRYEKGNWLGDLVGHHLSLLDAIKGRDALTISSALRLQPGEWKELCYEELREEARATYCRFLSQRIRLDRLNLTRPRICPDCLREDEVCPAIWDLAIFASCPKHHRELVADCWKCNRPIRWSRLSVTQCKCGADLRCGTGLPANAYVDSMSAALLRAVNPHENDQTTCNSIFRFPSELDRLGLNSLVVLISFLGAMGRGRHVKQTAYTPTSIASTTQVVQTAGKLLANWPEGFHDSLSRLQEHSSRFTTAVTFKDAFGHHFEELLGLGEDFSFIRTEFEQFVLVKWSGVVRGQHRSFSESLHSEYPWITAQEAMRTSHIAVTRLVALVRSGTLEGKFVSPQRGNGRTECWILRPSLERLVFQRDEDRQQYISRQGAASRLGLSVASLDELCHSGVLPFVSGYEKHLPNGIYCRKHDVERLRSLCRAFDECLNVEDDQSLISLEAARRSVLGGRGTLSSVVSDMLSGLLVPLGHTLDSNCEHLFNSLVFRRKDLNKYIRPIEWKSLPAGFITYTKAARKLHTNTEVVRNLAAGKILYSPPELFNRCRIVSSIDVDSFARTYICIQSLADRYKTRSEWVARYLHSQGVQVLVIGLPGKGKKLFAKRIDVAGIEIPAANRARACM